MSMFATVLEAVEFLGCFEPSDITAELDLSAVEVAIELALLEGDGVIEYSEAAGLWHLAGLPELCDVTIEVGDR
jgi:hypothetical protein